MLLVLIMLLPPTSQHKQQTAMVAGWRACKQMGLLVVCYVVLLGLIMMLPPANQHKQQTRTMGWRADGQVGRVGQWADGQMG